MTLRLPGAPKDVDARAQALAAYYQLLPSPFGQKQGSTAAGRGVPSGSPGGVGNSAGSSAGAGGAGMGHESAGFVLGGVIVRALALSWKDDTFADQLIGNKEALTILENWLGYSCPWNMQFLVEKSSAQFKVKEGVWDPAPTNQLTFFVPNAPKNVADHALALASYNQTGDAYPLTCP
jgi:ribosomally synthesized peptide (two-chain TOMM family)